MLNPFFTMGSRAGLRKLIVKSRVSIGDETIITNVFPLRPRKRDLFRENAVQLDAEHASETQRIMRPPREIRLDLLKTISKLGDAPDADSTGSELSRGLADHFAQRNFALHLGEFSCYAPRWVMQCETPLTNVQRPTQTFRFMSELARFAVQILLRHGCF